MELSEYLAILRRHAVVIMLAGALGFGLAYGYATTLPPRYTATTSLYVAVPGGATVGERVQGANYAQERIESYAELAGTPFVIDPVIEELGLTMSPRSIARSLVVTSPLGTSVLDIGYTSSDPDRAAAVANSIATELAGAVSQLEGPGESGRSAVELTVVAQAETPAFPSSPNTRLLAVTGLLAGLGLAVLIVVARSVLDTRVRNEKDVRRVTDAAVVATVRRDRKASADPVVFRSAPLGDRAEAYRRLRTNLRFLEVAGSRRSILVTSAVPGEGKTTTALNLASAMAEGGARILLVDADLRRPSAAGYLGVEGAAGLTSVLIGEAHEDEVIQSYGQNLDVLAAGQIPPNPSEMLDSPAMAALLGRLTELYDVVVVDTPPLVPVTDAAALSRGVDGVLLVVGCQTVHRAQLEQALDSLQAVDARLLGLVLNQVSAKELGTTYAYTHTHRRGGARARTDDLREQLSGKGRGRRRAKDGGGTSSAASASEDASETSDAQDPTRGPWLPTRGESQRRQSQAHVAVDKAVGDPAGADSEAGPTEVIESVSNRQS